MREIICNVKCEHSKDGKCQNSESKFDKYIDQFGEPFPEAKVAYEIYGDDEGKLVTVNPWPVKHLCGSEYLYACTSVQDRNISIDFYTTEQLNIVEES